MKIAKEVDDPSVKSSRKAKAAACIFYAYKHSEVPKSMSLIAKLTECPQSTIARNIKHIKSKISIIQQVVPKQQSTRDGHECDHQSSNQPVREVNSSTSNDIPFVFSNTHTNLQNSDSNQTYAAPDSMKDAVRMSEKTLLELNPNTQYHHLGKDSAHHIQKS
ncbi:Oidioi.mRNA.OKI2018_I69.YSR.g17041.t1.cds [Oikopleura dioica]|uniref:Oidioi.mRNA.OKI2018_I69.YSR.g17041.t1.cds n=1 Tax=Oikopleura dioica TaxID=34765 RepID=A0ABN7SM88_OIKDI|nr:Oidioi.mRNA.OKI2018_I69.YSR.g17041.t1.cds [Oikopleura dioica]